MPKEVPMPGSRRLRRYFPWVPLGLLTGLAALVGASLLLPGGPQAQAAPPAPQPTAGFQTTERLVLTVTLPARLQEVPRWRPSA